MKIDHIQFQDALSGNGEDSDYSFSNVLFADKLLGYLLNKDEGRELIGKFIASKVTHSLSRDQYEHIVANALNRVARSQDGETVPKLVAIPYATWEHEISHPIVNLAEATQWLTIQVKNIFQQDNACIDLTHEWDKSVDSTGKHIRILRILGWEEEQ